ncbi:carbohydrate-binding module family 21 protein [Ceratobasidium sp. AG-Ba]|nr:carbohydrate-binding module family 21 protein [Ceratobasidium sp. AG-Ba]QRW09128.1 carbohydrate-binding module family 21 protein [Ceratobasidium sp. AG-Ba]
MPYSPPSSAFTAVDVPHFSRPTQGDPSFSPPPQSTRRTRNPSAGMINFSNERGPGAHKPLRGLPRRVKSSAPPSSIDLTTPSTADASVPRSLAALGPPVLPPAERSPSRGRAKFSVGDDSSSESASTSPKLSPSTENGPVFKPEDDSDITPTPTPQPAHPAWALNGTSPRASPSLAKTLSIDTSAAYTKPEEDTSVPFPLLSPEPAANEPITRRAAVIPFGALSHFTSSFANGSANDVDLPSPMIRSASSSMIPGASSAELGAARHLSGGAQKSFGGGGHGRSASMADARLDKYGRHSPTESGTSTPVIRKSNGQPLKPSLKSSLSSPNISAMGGPRPIAKSAPATPRVHFKELGLESVVLFDKGARPVAVSGEYGGADDTETETETENSRGYPFPRVPAAPTLVRLAPTTTQLAFQPPPQSYVHLQYLSLPPVRPPRLQGTVLVRNVAFGKSVIVRYTTDNWETASEIMAAYSASLPPGIIPGASDASWDKFTFTIKLDDIERSLPNRTLFCVVRYDAHGVGEWWDNNNGQNYRVEFERPDTPGAANADQSSTTKPFAPPQFTYHSDASATPPAPAPPAPLTKPRSYSTSIVTPPPPIKAPAQCGPSPHVLHLRLSNYVSPTANGGVPKAPLPGKPFEKKPLDKDEDRISPPSSPDTPKGELGLLTSDFGVDFHQTEKRDVFVPSPEVAPLKMPATLTPPDSAHNSPSSSPPAKRNPLPAPSMPPQPQDHGLLSPSSSPSTSMLITSPPSPSQDPASPNTEKDAKEGSLELGALPYSEVLSRFCFNHSPTGGNTPTGPGPSRTSSSAPLLGVMGLSNGSFVSSPKSSPRGGSPAGSGANSPATTSKNGMPRGGSFVLGTPGTAGAAYSKWSAPSGFAGL